MAGLWEQVGGIFWSVPPVAVPVEEVRPLSTIIMCGVVAAFALTAVLRYVSHKIRPQGWGVRKYLGAVGAALTLAYVAVVLPIIWGRVDTLLTMPLNEVGDFLAGAFGPLAILWLVLGFLQQGEELRQNTKAVEFQGDEIKLSREALLMQAEELKNSVEQQSIMAAAATAQMDAQRAALKLQMEEIEKAGRANFRFSSGSRSGGGAVGGQVKTSLSFICAGATAHDVTAVFDPPIGDVEICRFEEVSSTRNPQVALSFVNAAEDVLGVLRVNYMGSDGKRRQEEFRYSIRSADPWVKIKQAL
ncbi:hypothetical protein HWD96_07835 [Pseudomonas putida]|uniref:hypothetical protein n=1 Tax=Pseudomonas putida TaxID=303 RepID=UPI001F52816F|nr:hypothetical protein [Pseudomonas putida]MCI1022139.1 hypothetical protein [Pseudomonas putida]